MDPVEWVADNPEEVLDGPPVRRRPPRWAVAALLAAVVLLALGVGLAVHHQNSPGVVSSRRPSLTVSPSVPSATPAPSSRRHSFAPLKVQRTGFRLLGVHAGWQLFGRGAGVVVRIQLARGRITTTAIPPLASTGPVSFVVSGRVALVRPLDFVPGYEVIDGEPARAAPGSLGIGGPVLPGPHPGQFWAPDGRSSVVLVDARGRPVSPRVSIPVPREGFPQRDGAGYVLIDTGQGIYDARPDRRMLITRGTLLAAGPTGWLTSVCRKRGCQYTVVDRAGARRILRIHARQGVFQAASPGLISPDGSRAALITSGLRVELVDLTTGAVTTGGPSVDGQDGAQLEDQLAWSPDSRWLIAVHAGGLFAIRATGHADTALGHHVAASVLTLGVQLPPLFQVAIRPAIPPPR